MRITSALFDNRVARRVFLSFVVASLVPITILALLTSVRVSGALDERAYERLHDTSRSLGQQLLDRLATADEALAKLGSTEIAAAPIGIKAAQLIEQGRARRLVGPAFPWDAALLPQGGKTQLVSRSDEQGSGVFLIKQHPAGVIVGRVDPDHLASVLELLPYGFTLSVVDSRSRALILGNELTAEASRIALPSIAQTASSELAWFDDGKEQFAAHWELFLPSAFDAAPWSILVSQPAALARESLASFNQAFVYTVAISLILTALLSVSQIRRTLRPLDELVRGTKEIAARRFTARMKVEADDEFGELGRAMNDMAEHLGQQFGTLTAFAEIDRLILASESIEQVLDQVIARAAEVVPMSEVSVLMIDPDQSNRGRLCFRTSPSANEQVLERLEITAELDAWLTNDCRGKFGSVDTVRAYIPRLPTLGDYNRAITLPLMQAGELRGALIAQFSDKATVSDGELKSLRQLARRLAVAVSAADREQELFKRAHFDSLTNLPNRQLCHDRLHQAIAQARREGHQLAVLFIDLDSFKNVNDSFGHTIGDELLRETALRLMSSVRDTDTVARLGGDEYVVILPHIHGLLEVEAVVDKIMTRLARPFHLQDGEAVVSASIGVSIFPNDGKTSDELLRKADTAMYSAKDAGRARYVFFAKEMDDRVQARVTMLADLRRAVENQEFHLAYQPQVDLATGRLAGAEALLRWNRPDLGHVSPGLFIPLLEESELIDRLGRWIIGRALADLRQLRDSGAVLPRVSVNLASRQLFDEGLVASIASELKQNQLEGSDLELELTEHGFIADFERSNSIFTDCHNLGIRVAIDDFGTGYSSLGYLRELRFDLLKIDRSFICGLPDKSSLAIVEAVLAVSHTLGKKVIAEGVETEEQRALLAKLGCDVGQGYLFSQPMSAEAFLAWCEQYQRVAAPQQLLVIDR